MIDTSGLDAIAQEQAEDAPARLAQWMQQALGADLAAWFDARWQPAGLTCTGLEYGGDAEIGRAWRKVLGTQAPKNYLGWNPELPRPSQINSLRKGIADLAAAAKSLDTQPPIVRYQYAPHGIVDQRRALLFDGRRFLGWLGGVRRADTPAFETDRVQATDAQLPAVRAILRAHQVAARLHLDDSGMAGSNALVFSFGGRLVHGTKGAVAWLSDRRREYILALIRALEAKKGFTGYVDGVEVGLSRLATKLGRTHVLVTLSATSPALLHPFFELSPRQREVAGYVASGFSAPEVAEKLGISPATVRVHLRAIYDILGIASRAELGRLFESSLR